MQAKTDGITSAVNVDNSTEFSQLLTALPRECHIDIAWAAKNGTSGISLNKLDDKIKIVHMYFADDLDHKAERDTLGVISPLSSLAWSVFPIVATVTNIADSKSTKIDESQLEMRIRYPHETVSSEESNWITRLNIPVAVATVKPSETVSATTTAELPKTPDLMPNAATPTAPVIPETQAQAQQAVSNAVEQAQKPQTVAEAAAAQSATQATAITKPEIITPIIKSEAAAPTVMPEMTLPIIKSESYSQDIEKTNYLPWVAGGLALWLLLRK